MVFTYTFERTAKFVGIFFGGPILTKSTFFPMNDSSTYYEQLLFHREKKDSLSLSLWKDISPQLPHSVCTENGQVPRYAGEGGGGGEGG